MDLKQLKYFVTVVEEGTISAAAKKLFMSQPPLSTQIKLLEEEFGCLLFQRGQRQIQLTEAGKRLYEKAVILLEISRVTKEEVRECATANAGIIRLGLVSSITFPMATKLVAEFSKLHPEINFQIYESNTYDLIEKLQANIVQLAIVRTPYLEENLTVEPLETEALVAIGKASSFPDNGALSTLAGLSAIPIILYRRWEAVIKGEFEKEGLSLSLKCVCDNAGTVVNLVEQGVGVGIVPASAVRLISDPDIVWKQIEACRIESRIDLVSCKNAYLPSYVKEFKRYLNEKFTSSN